MPIRQDGWTLDRISVVVPAYDEAPNLGPLVDRLEPVLRALGLAFEIVIVDDGSRDQTADVLRALAARVPELRALRLQRNFGQTQALQAGLDFASGDAIVTMDGDLQNDPEDIPRLLEALRAGADVVSGWRENRQDAVLLRKIPSRAANALIRLVTGVPIHDQGCALKAYRSDVIRRLDLYADMHRFVAVLSLPLGARIEEIPVRHHARTAGESKYGIWRVLQVLGDLAGIQMLARFSENPIRWFALLASPFLIGSAGAFVAGRIIAPASVVPTTIALLMALTFVSTVLFGVVGEAIVELAEERRHEPLQREWKVVP